MMISVMQYCPVMITRQKDGRIETLCNADGDVIVLASKEYAFQWLAIMGIDPVSVNICAIETEE